MDYITRLRLYIELHPVLVFFICILRRSSARKWKHQNIGTSSANKLPTIFIRTYQRPKLSAALKSNLKSTLVAYRQSKCLLQMLANMKILALHSFAYTTVVCIFPAGKNQVVHLSLTRRLAGPDHLVWS